MTYSGKALQLRTQVARAGEEAACAHLSKLGYKIVCRNWRRGRLAELDIIAREPGGLLVFVEVKTRRLPAGPADDRGFEAIDWRKRRKILLAARSYLAGSDCPSRIDAIVAYFTRAQQLEDRVHLIGLDLRHVENVF